MNYDDYVVSYNKQAMNALKNEQRSVSFTLLKQATQILTKKTVPFSQPIAKYIK